MSARPSMRPGAAFAFVVAPLLLLAATIGMSFSTDGWDYTRVVAPDNPAPAIVAIAHGDLHTAAHVMPAMGLVSLIVRLPLAVFGGGDLWWSYRLGALACLLPLLVLAFLLDRASVRAGATTVVRVVRAGLIVTAPTVSFALKSGHPEEILTGVLCVAAVLAGLADRRLAASVLLGLAIGTKQGAVVAAVPVLLAIGGDRLFDSRRVVAGVIAVAVAAACILPVAPLDTHRYRESSKELANTRAAYTTTLWWPVSHHTERITSLGGGQTTTIRTSRLPLDLHRGVATSVALLASLALLLVPAIRRRAVDPVALLVLVLMLRCAFDPANIDYYVAPAMIALATWETRRSPAGLPIITLLTTLLTYVTWRMMGDAMPLPQFVAWIVCTAPLALPAFLPTRRPDEERAHRLVPRGRPFTAGRAPG